MGRIAVENAEETGVNISGVPGEDAVIVAATEGDFAEDLAVAFFPGVVGVFDYDEFVGVGIESRGIGDILVSNKLIGVIFGTREEDFFGEVGANDFINGATEIFLGATGVFHHIGKGTENAGFVAGEGIEDDFVVFKIMADNDLCDTDIGFFIFGGVVEFLVSIGMDVIVAIHIGDV